MLEKLSGHGWVLPFDACILYIRAHFYIRTWAIPRLVSRPTIINGENFGKILDPTSRVMQTSCQAGRRHIYRSNQGGKLAVFSHFVKMANFNDLLPNKYPF